MSSQRGDAPAGKRLAPAGDPAASGVSAFSGWRSGLACGPDTTSVTTCMGSDVVDGLLALIPALVAFGWTGLADDEAVGLDGAPDADSDEVDDGGAELGTSPVPTGAEGAGAAGWTCG